MAQITVFVTDGHMYHVSARCASSSSASVAVVFHQVLADRQTGGERLITVRQTAQIGTLLQARRRLY